MGLTINDVRAAFSQLKGAELDRNVDQLFTLGTPNPLERQPNTGTLGSHTVKPASRGLFGGLFGKSAPATPSYQSTYEFRLNFWKSLVDSQTANLASDAEMQKFMQGVSERLFGNGKNVDLAKTPLLARTVTQILDDVEKKQLETSARLYRESHADTIKVTDNQLARLDVLASQLKNGALADEVKKFIADWKGKFTPKAIATLDVESIASYLDGNYLLEQTLGTDLLARVNNALHAQYREDASSLLAQEGRLAEETLEKEWNATFGGDDSHLTPEDLAAAKRELAAYAETLTFAARTLSADDDMAAVKKELDTDRAKKAAELHAKVAEILEASEKKGLARAAREQALQAFEATCTEALKNLGENLAFERKAFVQRWRDEFGEDGALRREAGEKTLSQLEKQLHEETGGFRPKAEPGVPEETPEDFEKCLKDLSDAFVQNLKDVRTKFTAEADKLLAAERPVHAKEVADRRMQALVTFGKTLLAPYEQAVETACAKLPEGDAGRSQLQTAKTSLADKVSALLALKPDDTPDTVKARLDQVTQLVNEAHLALAEGEHALVAKAFAAAVDAHVQSFQDKLTTVLDEFLDDWNAKFPAPNENVIAEMAADPDRNEFLDRSRDAIHRLLAEKGRQALEEAKLAVLSAGDTKSLAPEVFAAFETQLAAVKALSEKLLNEAGEQAAQRDAAQENFNGSLEVFASVYQELADVLTTWDFSKGPQTEENGLGVSVAEKYLRERMVALNALLDDAYRQFGAAGNISAQSFQLAAGQLKAFADRVRQAVTQANGDATRLMQALRALPAPTLKVKTVAQELADAAFADGTGVPATDERVPEAIRTQVDSFRALLKTALDRVAARQDVAAIYRFQAIQREVYTQVVDAVNAAAANGVDLGVNIGGLLRDAWRKVADATVRLENGSGLAAFHAKVLEKQQALDAALAAPPKKMNAKKRTARAAAIAQAQATLAALADDVDRQVNALTQAGRKPLARLTDQVLALVNGIDVFLGALGKAPFPAAFPEGAVPVALEGEAQDPLQGVAEGAFASTEALDKAVRTVRDAARQSALDGAETRWNDAFQLVRDTVTVANEDRVAATEAAEAEAAKLGERAPKDASDIDAQRRAREEAEAQRLADAGNAKPQAPKESSLARRRLEQARLAKEKAALEEKRKVARVAFEKARGPALETYAKERRAALGKLFLDCPGMERYLVRDGLGNVTGWTRDGENILDEVVRQQTACAREQAFEAYFAGTPDAPFTAFTDAASRDALQDALRAYEAKFPPQTNLASLPGRFTYARGNDIFGLDLAKLPPAARAGLENYLRTVMGPDLAKNLDKALHDRLFDFPKYMPGAFFSAAGVARAIHEGNVDLAAISPKIAILIDFMYIAHEVTSIGMGPDAGMGTSDIGVMLARLKEAGIDAKSVEQLTEKELTALAQVMLPLFWLNGCRAEGLEEMSRRVYGRSLFDAARTQAAGKDRDFISLVQALGHAEELQKDPLWRSIYDPVARFNDAERKALAILEMNYAFQPKDAKDLAALRGALAQLAGKPDGAKTELKLAGVTVTLVRKDAHHLAATMRVGKTDVTYDKETKDVDKIVRQKGETDVPVHVPVTVEMLRDSMEATVVADIPTYGPAAVKDIFDAYRREAGDAYPTSSHTRQLCVSFLKSYAALDTSKLCFVPTRELASLVDFLFTDERYAAMATPAERGKAIMNERLAGSFSATLLNSNATLEVYETYRADVAQHPDRVRAAVNVPDPAPVKRGETLEAARMRRLHEFASNLIQPEDTTKYDIDRQHGLSETAILRERLVAGRAELKDLLNMEDAEIISLFTLKGRDGMALAAFAETIAELVRSLRTLRDAVGEEMLFTRLANAGDFETEQILAAARAKLTKSSQDVLGNLQGAFTSLFVEAFQASVAAGKEDVWKRSLDELSRTVVIDPNKGYGLFLQKVLGEYFTRMEEVDRNRMAALVMRYATNEASLGQVLGALLKGSGPILQKLMQGLPESALPPVLAEAVKDIKSNLAPIPEEAVRAYLYDIVQQSNGAITNITVKKSLGAASVGQAFLCVVKTQDHPEGEECVVKLLRPDVQSRARREEGFFRQMIGSENLGATLTARFDGIFDELDLTIEARNVAQGAVYDPNGSAHGVARVQSMKLHPAGRSTTNVLFLRRASGDTYDHFLDDARTEKKALLAQCDLSLDKNGVPVYRPRDPYACRNVPFRAKKLLEKLVRRQKDMYDLITRWTEEVAFGGGFFHGDVHSGNIMTDANGLTLIDFGNATRLSENERSVVMYLLVHATFNNPQNFLDKFTELLSEEGARQFKALPAEVRSKMAADLGTIFAKGGRRDVGKRFVAALQYLQNAQVEIPGAIFNLTECMRRLDESLTSLNKEIAQVKSLGLHVDAVPKLPLDGTKAYWFDKPMYDAITREEQEADRGRLYIVLSNKEKEAQREFIATRLRAACKSRSVFEETVADVRRLIARSDMTFSINFRAPLEQALALVGSDDAFFTGEDSTLREQFVTGLTKAIMDVQAYLLRQMSSREEGTTYRTIAKDVQDFADAVGDAVDEKEAAKRLDGWTKTKLGFSGKAFGDPVEEAYQERLGAVDDIVNAPDSPFKQISSDEVGQLLPLFRYFRTPPAFKDMVAKGKWAAKPENRTTALDTFRWTLSEMKRVFAANPLLTKAENPHVLYARLLALGYCARFETSGFEAKKMSDAEFEQLVRDAGDDAPLVAFLREARARANE